MSHPLVECIPNFSEGRRMEVVDAIVASITSVEGVVLLDRTSDADHNRSVVTIVGSPEAVEQGAFLGIAKAAELINMPKHKGEHPRMGAADVVPFVPISGVKMSDCVAIAKRLGQRVGDELGIPVYLYEEAATSDSRRNLANVRRGEYEGIKKEIVALESRKPDFGPAKLGSAGAVAIGARQPLIAYNVFLNTEDVSIAKKIASTVRHSSGGLRYVKGAGFLVDGKAQVSMNLTNFKKTPVALVVETIRRETQRYGVSIEKSELIGLIPQDALEDAAAWYLQLDDFDRQQVLERRMQSSQDEGERQEVGGFLSALASASPAPGGGSASAQAGAMAAALVAMVARLTVGNKKYAEVEPQMAALIEKADNFRAAFSSAVSRDANAFEAVMAAFKMPKGSEKEKSARQKSIQSATLEAARVPLEVAQMALDCLFLAEQAAEFGNTNAISDAGTAAALAQACLQGAGLNVRINLASLKPSKETQKLGDHLKTIEKQFALHQSLIQKHIESRGGFSLS
ncbi:MAG: glutamate formimidoyltransferase [Chloroflexi bacterium]|nr:glutamate formimidoyltransferase [Chloroflexota bacterium]MQC26172.1 glutamate formimidoyltransferase [Chloroflexota bacterium]